MVLSGRGHCRGGFAVTEGCGAFKPFDPLAAAPLCLIAAGPARADRQRHCFEALVYASLLTLCGFALPYGLRRRSEECSSSGVCSVGQEAGDDSDHLAACLRAVELEYLLARGKGWEQVGRAARLRQRLTMHVVLFSFVVIFDCELWQR